MCFKFRVTHALRIAIKLSEVSFKTKCRQVERGEKSRGNLASGAWGRSPQMI